MDSGLRRSFETFDHSYRSLEGAGRPPASPDGVRESYFMAGVRALAGTRTSEPSKAKRRRLAPQPVALYVVMVRDSAGNATVYGPFGDEQETTQWMLANAACGLDMEGFRLVSPSPDRRRGERPTLEVVR